MAEHLSESPNRWELLTQGASPRSDIARFVQFAGELELKSTKLPKKAPKYSSIVYRSLLDLLYVALQRDMLLAQEIEHFREVGDKYEVSRRSSAFCLVAFSDPSTLDRLFGPVGDDEKDKKQRVFGTTRSWSNTSRAPHISGSRTGKKLEVRISSTSDAANPYNNEVLPGINEIIIGEKGDMTVSGWRRGYIEERPTMSIVRKHILAGVLNNCKEDLSHVLERDRRYFQQIKSPTQPQRL